MKHLARIATLQRTIKKPARFNTARVLLVACGLWLAACGLQLEGYAFRLPLKNADNSAPHSSANTPPSTCMRWFIHG